VSGKPLCLVLQWEGEGPLNRTDRLTYTFQSSAEDATVYTSSELKALIEQLSLGNATAGGLTRPIEPFWGIVGQPRILFN
jgi:hypothetical protein